MKRTILFLSLALASLVASAQTDSISMEKKTHELKEVVIESSNVVRHNGYDVYIPSTGQRKHSANGFDLLEKVQLPGIRIDQVEKKVLNTTGTGSVVVKINNVVASIEDLQALTPGQVINVEFTTSPGMKYGAGVGAVINVKTRREDKGFALGLNTMNSLTCNYNDDGVWAKLFNGRSEFGLQYGFRLNEVTNAFTQKEETFRYTDNTMKTLFKDGHFTGGNFRSDAFTLTYNYTLPNKRVLDVKGSYSWERFPRRNLDETVTGDENFTMRTYTQSDERVANLKAYYNERLSRRDELELSAALAYLDNNYDRGFSSPAMQNIYTVNGDKYSLRAHADFTHVFTQKRKIAFGYQHAASYTINEYVGTQDYAAGMNNNSQYLFSEYTATLGNLSMVAGIGGSREHFSQGSARYTFFSFRPVLSMQYNIDRCWTAAYRFNRRPNNPSLSQLTAYGRQDDSDQATIGNPALKPYNKDAHLLMFNFRKKQTSLRLYGLYESVRDGIGNLPIVEQDGIFWHRLANNICHDHFETALYFSQSLFQRRLSFYVEPKIDCDKSTGATRNSNTNISVQIGCNGFYKNWSANLYFRSATETLFGDILIHNYPTSDFSVGYRHKSLQAKLGLRNAFDNSGKTARTTQLSDVVSSKITQGNSGFGNMVYLSMSWNFLKGKQTNSQRAKDINADMDSGILK